MKVLNKNRYYFCLLHFDKYVENERRQYFRLKLDFSL